MRQDETVAGEVLDSEDWDRDPETGELNELIDARVETGDRIVDGKLQVDSLSGHERNKLYVNSGKGEDFENRSGLSGLDDEADGRGFALLDYDRDGWQDVVLVNAMNPLTRLFRNELGDRGETAKMIALSLIGGNETAGVSEWSNRDGYGAQIEVRKAGEVIRREHRCGEGYGSQNSATIRIGIGDWEAVDEIAVTWPSGKKSLVSEIAPGEWVTIRERGGESRASYLKKVAQKERPFIGGPRFPLKSPGAAKLTVWKGMATWCPACARYQPKIAHLKAMTADRGVAFHAFPLDQAETRETLQSYQKENALPYQLLTDLSDRQRSLITEFLSRLLGAQEVPLPATVVTNQKGHIVWYGAGVPTVSRLRQLLTYESR